MIPSFIIAALKACLGLRMEKLVPHWPEIREILCWGLLIKCVF
jgi:hypothetical protein